MLKHIVLVCMLSLVGNTFGQNFNELTSSIFFGADIKSSDTALLSYFKSKQDLKYKKDIGWTVYPPRDGKNAQVLYHSFSFSKHPYFLSSIRDGTVTAITTVSPDSIIGLSISLSFNSYEDFDSTYKEISASYSKNSSEVVKRPGIAQPFEVIKYRSTGNDFVIITKGENDNKPYIVIAFNYQDYDW